MSDTVPSVRPRFDLITQPWIMVRGTDGTVRDVSIREAFGRAETITEIVGEVTTQTFAITRLLVAILTRAIKRARGEGRLTMKAWSSLWENGLPLDDIDAYLNAYASRFDLFNPEKPFFQVAGLRTSKNEFKDAGQLVFDLPSNSRLFTTRAGSQAERVSFPEAARWLVNAQAFDPSGIKSGAVGDDRVKGGKGYPIGVAWSGLLGGLLVEGENLRQTLILNLTGPREGTDDWEGDIPPWEREPDTATERPDRFPRGPVDLATWQSRRIRLIPEAAAVTGSLICNGDKLTPQNQFANEMATAWRFSVPQTKKNDGQDTYMPLEHDPSRALWRGIGALLPTVTPRQAKHQAAARIAPGVLQWLSAVQGHGRLPRDFFFSVRAIGVAYQNKGTMVEEIVDDRLHFSLALLDAENPRLAQAASDAVVCADQGVQALSRLAENLARAAGGEPDGPRAAAQADGYAALDEPYRHWIASLRTDSEPDAELTRWKRIAHTALLREGEELLSQAGPTAWAGRHITLRTGQDQVISTSRADGWFRAALRNTFGEPQRKENPDGSR